MVVSEGLEGPPGKGASVHQLEDSDIQVVDNSGNLLVRVNSTTSELEDPILSARSRVGFKSSELLGSISGKGNTLGRVHSGFVPNEDAIQVKNKIEKKDE